jgi:hypothetical protein
MLGEHIIKRKIRPALSVVGLRQKRGNFLNFDNEIFSVGTSDVVSGRLA